VNENNVQIMSNSQSRFLLSTFIKDSGLSSTGLPILPIAKEQTRPKNDVLFYVLMKTTSNNMVFFDHQNKCRPALRVEVLSLCIGDSSFDHVPMNSFHCKTSGDASIKNTIVETMQNRVLEMTVVFFIDASQISVSHESVVLDISPLPSASFFLFFYDTKSIFHHDRHYTGNARSSTFLPFTQQNRPKMQGTKVVYPPFLLAPLFQNTWDCIRCKTTKRGGVKITTRS
jgi:hypothetical protein